MASYLEWNSAIFKYFFNKDSISDTVFFCVDREIINFIGETIGVTENIEEDFCKHVLEQIVVLNNKNVYKLSAQNEYKLTQIKEIPYQTAIIAFFIYVASRMGENSQFSITNYWSLFKDIVENFYEPFDVKRHSSIYDFLFKIFENFKISITTHYNKDFTFMSILCPFN